MKTKLFIKKIVILLIGLIIAHLGVTLFIQTNLGSDPFNVFIQGLFRSIPWPAGLPITHGRTHMLICFLIILVLLVVDKSYIRIGTIICMFFGGPIIDFFTWLLGGFINDRLALPLRLILLVAGCIILALGMTIVIRSEAGTGTHELVRIVPADKVH